MQLCVITVEIQTNGVAVGRDRLTTLSGDINAAFRAGRHTIAWSPRKEGFGKTGLPQATAKVTAWAIDAPPPVMAISMEKPSCVRFYADMADLPGGLATGFRLFAPARYRFPLE
ncbi:MAG: hypothetical protein IJK04_00785 [Kiritimatiellae bacterium]|nr:hypothetical protein [Kiritimatiellia bacterium]